MKQVFNQWLDFWFIEIQWLHLFSNFHGCVCQADRDLQPWIAKDDGQKIWRINQRIVKLIVELMRNHDNPEPLVILASASDLLLRATDGMLVDGEACTLPQLEVPFYEFFFIFAVTFSWNCDFCIPENYLRQLCHFSLLFASSHSQPIFCFMKLYQSQFYSVVCVPHIMLLIIPLYILCFSKSYDVFHTQAITICATKHFD